MARRKPVTVYNSSNTNVLARVSSYSVIELFRDINLGNFSKQFADSFDQISKSGYSVVEKYSRVEFFPEKAKETAYVSIKPSDNGKSTYIHLCQDHPVQSEGYGVIVTGNFYIRNAKDEWKDIDGINHKPLQNPSRTGPEPTGLNFLATNNHNLEITCITTANAIDNTGN
ncbi:unnamed protein product [Mytilus coruscus]|uniref:Uncharacterized protein n=1 Tax=Mytilus coruscus TaxID=42192 RepID=A0A6J8D3F6_MYTCO|nr:unnamed protein product [Mytilus coruscus]